MLLDAASNLGLRPPEERVGPGVYELAGALRDERLLERLDCRGGRRRHAAALVGSRRAAGVEITIFDSDPDLDPTGELAARLADALVHALRF